MMMLLECWLRSGAIFCDNSSISGLLHADSRLKNTLVTFSSISPVLGRMVFSNVGSSGLLQMASMASCSRRMPSIMAGS